MKRIYSTMFILLVLSLHANAQCDEPSYILKVYNAKATPQLIKDAAIELFFEVEEEYTPIRTDEKGIACIEKSFSVDTRGKKRKNLFYEINKDGFKPKNGRVELKDLETKGFSWTEYIDPEIFEFNLSFNLDSTKTDRALVEYIKINGLIPGAENENFNDRVLPDSLGNFMLSIPDTITNLNIETYGYRSKEYIYKDTLKLYEKIYLNDASTYPIKITLIEKDNPELTIPAVKLSFLSHDLKDLYTNDYGEINIENLAPGIYVYKIHNPLKYSIEEDIGFFKINPTDGDRPNETVISLLPKKYTINGTITINDGSIDNFTPAKFEISLPGIEKTLQPIVNENGEYSISIPPSYFEQNKKHTYTINIEDERIEMYKAKNIFTIEEYNNRQKTKNIQLQSKYQDYKFKLKGKIDREVEFIFKQNEQIQTIWARPTVNPNGLSTSFIVNGLVNYREVVISDKFNGICRSKKFRKKEIERIEEDDPLKLKKCKNKKSS